MNYWIKAKSDALKRGDYLLVRYCQEQINLIEVHQNDSSI